MRTKVVNGVRVAMTQEEIDALGQSVVPLVPTQVTALRGMLALEAEGLAEAFEQWANHQDRTFAERAFINKALHWKRSDPVLQAGAQALGLTEEQMDNLFITASTL